MFYVEIVLLVLGVVLLVAGYRRDRRNLLLAGAIVLFLSSAGPQLVSGAVQGFHDGWAASSASR